MSIRLTGCKLVLLLLALLLVACGETAVPTVTATVSAEIKLGQQVFTDNCAICHATTPDTVVRGPSLDGIATRANDRVPGQDARAYIFNSIMRPADYIVPDYDNIMPTTLSKTLTGEELDAVVAYLLTMQ